MIIKFSLLRLTIVFLLVILFPLVQNQWLNLYLFDINNLTIYKFLYYISGLFCPIIVCLNSLNNFTYFKFSNIKTQNVNEITGKSLLITVVIVLFTLSTLIYNYIFINFKIISNLFINENNYINYFDINKQILVIGAISILLIFKKIKLIIKKILLINFFIISIISWYCQINKILLNDLYLINNIFKMEDINYFNIVFLFSIEILYYLWSYISNGTYLSDWKMPTLTKSGITPIFEIIISHLFIIVYYSILLD